MNIKTFKANEAGKLIEAVALYSETLGIEEMISIAPEGKLRLMSDGTNTELDLADEDVISKCTKRILSQTLCELRVEIMRLLQSIEPYLRSDNIRYSLDFSAYATDVDFYNEQGLIYLQPDIVPELRYQPDSVFDDSALVYKALNLKLWLETLKEAYEGCKAVSFITAADKVTLGN